LRKTPAVDSAIRGRLSPPQPCLSDKNILIEPAKTKSQVEKTLPFQRIVANQL
jgi:hypothetical protein